jgi:hypothetical protein
VAIFFSLIRDFLKHVLHLTDLPFELKLGWKAIRILENLVSKPQVLRYIAVILNSKGCS